MSDPELRDTSIRQVLGLMPTLQAALLFRYRRRKLVSYLSSVATLPQHLALESKLNSVSIVQIKALKPTSNESRSLCSPLIAKYIAASISLTENTVCFCLQL